MKEIKALVQAQQVPKVVLAMQNTGIFPDVSISEVRLIDRNAPLGIGGMADRLISPTLYLRLEILCTDEETEVLAEAIRNAAALGKCDSGRLYICPVESRTEVFSEGKPDREP